MDHKSNWTKEWYKDERMDERTGGRANGKRGTRTRRRSFILLPLFLIYSARTSAPICALWGAPKWIKIIFIKLQNLFNYTALNSNKTEKNNNKTVTLSLSIQLNRAFWRYLHLNDGDTMQTVIIIFDLGGGVRGAVRLEVYAQASERANAQRQYNNKMLV